MNLVLVLKQPERNSVYRSVAPAFVEESSVFVEGLEEVDVGL